MAKAQSLNRAITIHDLDDDDDSDDEDDDYDPDDQSESESSHDDDDDEDDEDDDASYRSGDESDEGLDSSGSAVSDSDNSEDGSRYKKKEKSKKSSSSSATDKVKGTLAAAKKRAIGPNGTGGGAMKKVKRESDDFKVEKKATASNSNQHTGEAKVKNEVVEVIEIKSEPHQQSSVVIDI
jgi:hypothetical protein